MSHSLTFRLETKLLWCHTPSQKKKDVVFTTVTMSTCQDPCQANAGVSKVCEIFKVRGIESLKYNREFHTYCETYCLLLWRHFHTPKRDAERTNCDWLFDMSVKQLHGRILALTNEGCHLFQTFSCQSEGLATRDYGLVNKQ